MKSNKNIIKKFKILVLKSYWRAALNPLVGPMRPAGRVFEVPALKQHCLPSCTPKATLFTFVYP